MTVSPHGARDNAEPALRRPARRSGRPRAGTAPIPRQEPIETMTPLPELEAVRAAPPAMPAHTLAIGTRLREYEVKGLIGEGTCAIVYLAWDHALQRKVAVKEYMPASMVGRIQGSTNVVVAADRHVDAVRAGLKGFINEGRLLARFDHPSLVKVYRFWEENGTAYMVMPYYEGPTLKAALAELGHVPSESELRTWLKPILNAVTLLHEGGVWHQNIGPDEILLTPFGPVLLGFAAAGHAIEGMNHTPAAALKAGFAAIEQYGSEAATTRGPWTDLYALAAVIYAAITGSEPAPAADRLTDDKLRPLAIVAAGLYSARFLTAIDAAMSVQPKQRPADHTEFRALMGDIEAPETVSLAPRPDLMQEPFGGAAGGPREITVPDRPLLAGAEPATAPTAVARDTRVPAPPTPPPTPTGSNADARAAVTPSWMKSARARALIGKRALYGIVAGTFALIGIAALVLQFASRSAGRVPAATATAATTMRAAALAAPAASTPATALATVTPTTPAPEAQPSPPPASVKPTLMTPAATTAPTPAATAPTLAHTAPHPASAPTTAASRTVPGPTAVAAAHTVPTPTPPAARTAAPVAAAAPAPAALVATSPEERQARCTEILQKASLEKITPTETDFFKRECK
jgi:serine/threonine protein kinase